MMLVGVVDEGVVWDIFARPARYAHNSELIYEIGNNSSIPDLITTTTAIYCLKVDNYDL